MRSLERHQWLAISVSSVLAGTFLLFWSVSAMRSASHTPDTIPAVDAFLGSVDWIWLTGLGVLLVLAGFGRLLHSLSQRSRIVSVACSALGVLLIAAWLGFVALSLSNVGGMLFFSPILGTGGLLLVLGVTGFESTTPVLA